MELDKDFKEFLALLNQQEVEYLIVGGYAVAFHGHPRYTGDIDVWINPTHANGAKLIRAIEAFGFEVDPLKQIDFERETVAFHLGSPPVRIDIMNRISGMEFLDCYPGRIEMEIEGITIYYIGQQDLIANKRASGRQKDLGDIENLQ
jgi:predicted nucleotidyltransferase